MVFLYYMKVGKSPALWLILIEGWSRECIHDETLSENILILLNKLEYNFEKTQCMFVSAKMLLRKPVIGEGDIVSESGGYQQRVSFYRALKKLNKKSHNNYSTQNHGYV